MVHLRTLSRHGSPDRRPHRGVGDHALQARPIPGTSGRREPIRRYLFPISTNGDLNANAAPQIEGWLLRDPTGRYHGWASSDPGFKFNITEEALACLMRHRAVER